MFTSAQHCKLPPACVLRNVRLGLIQPLSGHVVSVRSGRQYGCPVLKMSCHGYAGVLEHALVVEGTADLHVAALQALLALAVQHAAAVRGRYCSRLTWLQALLGHANSAGTLVDALACTCAQAHSYECMHACERLCMFNWSLQLLLQHLRETTSLNIMFWQVCCRLHRVGCWGKTTD